MKYTKGPWKADIRTGCFAIYPANENWNCLSGADKSAIAFQDGRGEPSGPDSYLMLSDEQIANAKLMAASPELLKKLKFMTALVRLKYGNRDKEIFKEIEESESLIKSLGEENDTIR